MAVDVDKGDADPKSSGGVESTASVPVYYVRKRLHQHTTNKTYRLRGQIGLEARQHLRLAYWSAESKPVFCMEACTVGLFVLLSDDEGERVSRVLLVLNVGFLLIFRWR